MGEDDCRLQQQEQSDDWLSIQEIEKLKHRDDLAIDWDKAIIEPIGDDDDD